MEALFFVGYILAFILLVLIVYRVKVLGFKSCFHNITEFVGREKNLFFEINHFCLVLASLLAPVILFVYPSYFEQATDGFETTKILLVTISFIIYLTSMLAGFYHLVYVLGRMWISGKDKKRSK
jgi:hypothetical protein